jgi:hypothetical protein
VGRGQREKKGAGGEEKEAGRMVRVDGHHLKLYSECWTALFRDGEGRVWGLVEIREKQIPFGNDNKKGKCKGNSRFLRCAAE